MGSSGEPSEKCIDPTVGGLVWVRRRNGSWWPGRILGLDEVSESCVVSPRSGTPVKLLGREDASVDWYNLEKSKRVKAFRCGEYDDCIAKAKASAANSGKKAVKYARREDAIIHALEIESSRLGNADIIISAAATSAGESPSSVSQSNPHKTYDNDEDDEDDDVNASGLVKNPDSLKESRIEDPNLMSPSKVQSSEGGRRRRVRRRSPNDSEDEGVKRMRGLEDLGLGVKVQTGGGLLELVKLDNASSLSDSRNSLPNGNGGASNGGGRGGAASVKRKRSQVAASNGNEFSKRKNRRRPLTKVLESSTAVVVVAVPVVCNDRKGPRLESVESKRSGSDCNGVLELDRDTSSHVNNGVTKENGAFDEHGSADQNGSSDKLCDLPFVGEQKLSAGPSILVHSPSDKPKVRGLKRQSNQAEGPIPKNEPVKETSSTSPESGHTTIGQRLDKSPSKWQSKGKRNSRKTSRNRKQDSRKYSDMDNETSNGINGTKPDPEDGPMIEPGQRLLLPHRQSRFTVHSRYRTSDSLLYEVKVEVKRNERPPHVPLVSLMSKLTGKAVVGHPVAVEVLEDGFCDRLLSLMEKVVDADEKEEVEEIGGDDLEESHTDPVKRVPVVRGKGPKAKKPGLLPKKIRKLSSLTGGKKSEERKVTVKIEKPKVPVIACIPLKLVFSRINEAVNGSARQMNRV